MVLTRDRELWGIALQVENSHGAKGHEFITDKIELFERRGERGAVELWKQVRDRFEKLRTWPIGIYGQPETWPHEHAEPTLRWRAGVQHSSDVVAHRDILSTH